MRIYINDKEIKKDYSDLNLPQLLEEVRNDLDQKIIKKIIINEVEVNERYLRESLIEKEDVNEIKFILQNTKTLIKETLEEIDNYLPKLKKGCIETADLFRNGNFNNANKKYQNIIEGISWYSQTITNIVNLVNKEKYITKINNKLISLNEILNELMQAYGNEDNILIADVLEYEIPEFIDDFVDINNDLINILK